MSTEHVIRWSTAGAVLGVAAVAAVASYEHAADGVRSADGTPLAGALGPVEAFGIAPLEAACAEAGFRRGRAG